MQNISTSKICPACGKDLYDGNPIKSFTKCRHTVHENCLNSNSAGTKTACPICSNARETSPISTSTATPAKLKNYFECKSIVDESTGASRKHDEQIPQFSRSKSIIRQESSTSSNLAMPKENSSLNTGTTKWECSECTYENALNQASCSMCGKCKQPVELFRSLSELHPSVTSSESEKSHGSQQIFSSWSCLRCTYQNTENVEICEICENPRRSPENSASSYNGDFESRMKTENTTSESINISNLSLHSPTKLDNNSCVNGSLSKGLYDESADGLTPNRLDSAKLSSETSSLENLRQQHRDTCENSSSQQTTDTPSKKDEIITPVKRKSIVMEQSSYDTDQRSTASPAEYRVFIPNLPISESDADSQEILRKRLDALKPSNAYKIRCYSSIGIALIDVPTEYEQNHLIKTVQSIVFDHEKNLTVRFVDDFESNSYLVLPENLKEMVTAKELLKRWQTILNISTSTSCEMISIEFPNIFKITFPNFHEFLRTLHSDGFTFNHQIVRIHHRTTVSFFADLPSTITRDDIRSAINLRLGHQGRNSSIYVQCNSKNGTAVTIVPDVITQWSQIQEIILNNQSYPKRQKLSLRLVIPSIPADLSEDSVKKNILFENQVIHSKRIGNRLILEFEDSTIYGKCLQIGAVCVNGHMLRLQAFAELQTESQNRELIMKKWYENEMTRHKTDLREFLVDLDKPFFTCRWNPKKWLEHFSPLCGIQDKDSDTRRRLLRLTVMTDTVKIANEKRYRIETDEKEDAEIDLQSSRMKSIIYNHRSKLHPQRDMSKTFDRPFAETKVSVINKDCLVVYDELVREKKRPLLLNMANAETPGGGYRQGAGAQEENIFRRSNYHLSLDVELDTKQEAVRYWKMENGELKSVNSSEKIYPIAEFGAIYTSGITVFRDTEETGYAYLDKPWTNVCAIAVAAYNRPDLQSDQKTIVNKMAVGTRKKIENLFAIAHLHQHDSLVLSALGCGAFRNPPEHIVVIFQSVIEQYAGYFEEIRFAIVDDHNTGGRLNPNGNFVPFTKLDGFIAHPPRQDLETNMINGPFLIVEKNKDRFKVNEVKIFDLTLCQYGEMCHNQHDLQHAQKYSHPPLCWDYQKCERVKTDKVHASSFTHRIQCQNSGMCELLNDTQHQRRYNHPEFCSEKGHCENVKVEHLKKFCHVPVCKKALTCTEYLKKTADHCEQYRHIQSDCSYGSRCAHFHNQEHLTNYRHPFHSPCPLTPYSCAFHQTFLEQRANRSTRRDEQIEQHCARFSHVCPFGRDCNDSDPSHSATSIHVHRLVCPDKEKCSNLTDEEHLNSFTHPNIHDIRYLCHESGAKCRDRWKAEHIRRYRHSGNSNHIGVAHYSGLNGEVNFIRNHHKLSDGVLKYAKDENWKQSKSHVKEIIEWIRCLQPVHRCNKLIFESILTHGHVMSRSYMNQLRKPRFVAHAVTQHPQIRQIIDHRSNDGLVLAIRDFIQVLVAVEFDERHTTPPTPTPLAPRMAHFGSPPAPSAASASSSDEIEERKKTLKTAESKIKPYVKDADLKTIQHHAKLIVEGSIKLNETKSGIGYPQDESFGTNEQIFSIIGPHLGYYYGDILIVFKRDILYHPDTNFSIQAATTFGQSQNAYRFRPWLTDPGYPKDRIQHYHWTKLHCAVPDYEYAAAVELMALTGLKKKSLDVTLGQVKDRWMTTDSHTVFEGHLPQLVPLDYVDHIYIPKNIFQSFSNVHQDAAKTNFGDRLSITDHVVDMDNPANLDVTREKYQKYVLDKINHQIDQNQPQQHYGFTVTLPAGALKQYIVIPMTISQSSHRHGAAKDAIDTIYIYWSALGGDMTLAISNDKIESDKDQSANPSLLCHIGDTVKGNLDHDYHEPYSYLTVGFPLSHDILIGDTSLLKTKSNSFHRGCNIHDFITYCLIIKRKIGQVTLIHAGSNGVYNHETLTYTFQRHEIDLSTLNYIQLSANNHPVPVRNLIIAHEAIEEFHTSFDKILHDDDKTSGKSDVAEKPGKDEKKSTLRDFWARAKGAVFGSNDKKTRIPCKDSVNCLLQYSSSEAGNHNKKYSHPCRFSEICRTPSDHPHLEHIPHDVPMCKYDRDCRDRIDPIHRAKYRHTNLPDFLVPCRDEKHCQNTTIAHKTKYSHGENVLELM